jgi:hypothetical protein
LASATADVDIASPTCPKPRTRTKVQFRAKLVTMESTLTSIGTRVSSSA